MVVYVPSNVKNVEQCSFFGLLFVQFGHNLVKMPVQMFDDGLRQANL